MEKDKINLPANNLVRALILFSGLWIVFYCGSTLLLPLGSALIATPVEQGYGTF